MSEPLTPVLSLTDIFGPGHAYIPRADRRTSQWFASDPALLDFYTGGQICVAGGTSIVCSAGVVTEPIVQVMREAGLVPSNRCITYDSEAQSVALALAQPANGRRLVVQHVFPTGLLPDESFWVKPSVLAYLNNKANLPTLVPDAHVAPRAVHASRDVFVQGATALPAALKVATDFSTGGGTAVALCRSANDLLAATKRFAAAERIVVESFLEVVRNPCLQYVVFPNGDARYLGYSLQEVNDHGQYMGNWLELGNPLPEQQIQIGLEIAQRAAKRGYRGVVGIDLAELSDDRIVVLDLNFRVNGSTAALLLAPAIQKHRAASCLHLRSFTSTRFDRLLAATKAAVRAGLLLPLFMFDPAAGGYSGEISRLRAIVLGDSRQDIRDVESQIARNGVT